jgi:hypothetical protein
MPIIKVQLKNINTIKENKNIVIKGNFLYLIPIPDAKYMSLTSKC